MTVEKAGTEGRFVEGCTVMRAVERTRLALGRKLKSKVNQGKDYSQCEDLKRRGQRSKSLMLSFDAIKVSLVSSG